MGMPAQQLWTADDVRALPEDRKRYEVIDGVLFVSPSPRAAHQRMLMELFRLLDQFVRQHAIGELLSSPSDIEFDPRTMVQPDLFVMPLVQGRRQREFNEARGLLLAIEILSPSTVRRDRTVKKDLFMREGVPDYWIVDLKKRAIEWWRPGFNRARVETQSFAWHPAGASVPLTIDVAACFAAVLDD